VPAQLGLGEEQLVVEGHLEAALRRGDEVEALDDRCPTVEQFVRQTDGARDVVSGNAELDEQPVLGIEHCGLLGWLRQRSYQGRRPALVVMTTAHDARSTPWARIELP
jgi:hypothetical protein